MRSRLTILALALATGLGNLPAAAAPPNYQQALEAFEAERAQAGGPALSPADRATMTAAAAALAAALPEPGLKPGERAPDFVLPDAFGKPVRLRDLLAQGPVVVTFYRGAWCPYCNLQLRGLQQSLPQIERLGASLVAITPQRPDRSLEQVEKDGLPFAVLSDLDSSVIKAYRLHFELPDDLSALYRERFGLDLAAYNGAGRYELPVPGTVVIDRAGVVQAAFADTDYRQRMEPAAILAALERLRGER